MGKMEGENEDFQLRSTTATFFLEDMPSAWRILSNTFLSLLNFPTCNMRYETNAESWMCLVVTSVL
jgi:hypothetical protein